MTLRPVQIVKLILLSVGLWLAATLYIRDLPEALAGSTAFVTALPEGWLSVVVIRYAGGLVRDQLLTGVGVVGAVAMMIDGVALHWLPQAYGTDPTDLRNGAAWLLWGYGVSLGSAVLMISRTRPVTIRP